MIFPVYLAFLASLMADIPLDDLGLVCPACTKVFQTKQSCLAHLASARSCSWYRKGKLRALDLNADNASPFIGKAFTLPDLQQSESEEDPEDVAEYFPLDDIFHFIPPSESTPRLHQNVSSQPGEPGPSTSAFQARAHGRTLDKEDDERIEDIHSSAGKVIWMDDSLREH